MPKLQVIIASTRPGRGGASVADWFVPVARTHGGFEIGVTDLAELNLPMLDEPHHPRLQQYEHEHTKHWAAIVAAADAFVFVMPEYNYGFTAPLKNAIDYLHVEWAYKPVGFVSYGGISGGIRAVQMLKPVVSALKMVPVNAQVALQNYRQHFDGDRFAPDEGANAAAKEMLDDLERLSGALATLRHAS
jgi:NAD(P)H-dependent FMN reductase